MLLTLLLIPILDRTLQADLSAHKSHPNPFTPRIIFTGSDVSEVAVTTGLDSKHPLRALDDKAIYKAATRYYQTRVGFLPFDGLIPDSHNYSSFPKR